MIKKMVWLGLCAVLMSGCGGGSSDVASGVGSGGTGSYTSGPVTGLGSIIVNGIRYDVDSAAVNSEDDSGLSSTGLKLGMYVEVRGSDITPGSSGAVDRATATSVRVASDFIGPAQSVVRDINGDVTSFVVFGRPIQVTSKTVFAGNLTDGQVVSVYGFTSDGTYTATRVEVLGSSWPVYKVTGKVADWNSSTHRFSFGGRTFEYASDSVLPSNFRVGAWVRVRAAPFSILQSPIPVLTVTPAANGVQTAGVARVRGVVGTLTSSTQFVVNGVTVNASALGLSGLHEGVDRVVIRGKMVDGVLVATAGYVESDTEADAQEIELHGRASSVGPNSFVVKGVTVSFTPTSGGPIADNECIEVKGVHFDATMQLIATEVDRNQTDCRP
ncbi:MAG TPA: DUF5666 domain-containing protein [Aquabacterium sp.]|nr:DUF5666 domain-containing protein [Aquabacterium sp.]